MLHAAPELQRGDTLRARDDGRAGLSPWHLATGFLHGLYNYRIQKLVVRLPQVTRSPTRRVTGNEGCALTVLTVALQSLPLSPWPRFFKWDMWVSWEQE